MESMKLERFMDIDYSDDRANRKFTYSYVFTLCDYCMSWKSQLQHILFHYLLLNFSILLSLKPSKKFCGLEVIGGLNSTITNTDHTQKWHNRLTHISAKDLNSLMIMVCLVRIRCMTC